MGATKNKSKSSPVLVISVVLLLIAGGIYYAYTKTDLLGDHQQEKEQDYLVNASEPEKHNDLKKLSTINGLLIGRNEQDLEKVLGRPDESITQVEGLWRELYYYNKVVNDMDDKISSIKVTTKKDKDDFTSPRRVSTVEPVEPGYVIRSNTQVFGTVPPNQ